MSVALTALTAIPKLLVVCVGISLGDESFHAGLDNVDFTLTEVFLADPLTCPGDTECGGPEESVPGNTVPPDDGDD